MAANVLNSVECAKCYAKATFSFSPGRRADRYNYTNTKPRDRESLSLLYSNQ